MADFQPVRFGRIFVLELERGEDILKSVERLIAEKGMKRAVFQAGAGTVDSCSSHFAVKDENGQYHDCPLSWEGSPRHLCGVTGFIENGKPHLHGVLGNQEESWTVHLHEGCVCSGPFRLLAAELLD